MVVGLAVVLAGCSSGASKPTASNLGKFQTAANAFCATAYRDGNSIQAPTNVQQTSTALTQFAQVLQTLVENLKTLTPPSPEQAVFDSFTAGLESASATYVQGAAQIAAGGTAAINAVLNQTNGEATALAPEATSLGLADCVTFLNPSTSSGSTTTTTVGP